MRRSVFGNDVTANAVHDYADQVDISFWNKWDFDLESGRKELACKSVQKLFGKGL